MFVVILVGMRYLTLTIALLTLGCGRPNVPYYPGYEAYVEGFQQEAAVRSYPLELGILEVVNGSLGLNTPANCNPKTQQITINVLTWGTLNAVEKEIVIYHEFGHCLLKLDHVRNKTAIMNPALMRWTYYTMYKKQLLDDLFGAP